MTLKILDSGGYGPGHDGQAGLSRVTRYPGSGWPPAAERGHREQARLAAELTGLCRKETR